MCLPFTDFRYELERTYRVLFTRDQAELQNYIDIEAWLKDGYISESEAKDYHKYNHHLYKYAK